MSNNIKDTYDSTSLTKDIIERQNIIDLYQKKGYLDRDAAIKKIQELRKTDENVAIANAVAFMTSQIYIPFEQVPNELIIDELNKQINILMGKLMEKQVEENNEHKHI